jgi:polar amino acid transport system substrate-binding protein
MPTLNNWRLGTVVLSAVALAACGSSSSSSTANSSRAPSASTAASSTSTASSGGGGVASVEALVPASVKSKGTLTVASDATYAPDEFIGPSGQIVGFDPDIAKALGAVMGLKVDVVNATFDTIIPGLAAGKFDMGASGITDTKAREKVVDFADYFIAGESFYTTAQGGVSVGGIADICGKTVAVETGTTEATDAATQSKKCTAAGKAAVTILSFAAQNTVNLAVASGRAQLGFADSPAVAYQIKQSGGRFKVVGAAYATAPYGYACPKDGLCTAIVAGIKALMKNGTYMQILRKWGVTDGAIPASQVKINGATS